MTILGLARKASRDAACFLYSPISMGFEDLDGPQHRSLLLSTDLGREILGDK